MRFSERGVQFDGFPDSLGCSSKIAFSQQRNASLILTLRGIRLLSCLRDQDKGGNHSEAQEEQQDGIMLEKAIHN
jgi:hypothetical protein